MIPVGTTVWCKSTWEMEMVPHIVQAVIIDHGEAVRFDDGMRYHVPCYKVATQDTECDKRFDVLPDNAYPTLDAAIEAVAQNLGESINAAREEAERAQNWVRSCERTLERFRADPTGQLARRTPASETKV